jgi:hypothetical protein
MFLCHLEHATLSDPSKVSFKLADESFNKGKKWMK